MRIMHEASYYAGNTFVTLTYDDAHLPDDVGLHKRDLQLFLKRLRRDIEPRRIKYYACGEYGDQYGRPHYHAIIFGIPVIDPIYHYTRSVGSQDYYSLDAWPNGYIFIGDVNYKSARYVAGYIQKKYNGKLAKEVYGSKEPPFQCQSNGIGRAYVARHHDKLIDNNYLTVNGVKHRIPRYYKRVLGDDLTEERKDMIAIDLSAKHEQRLNDMGIKDHMGSIAKQHDRDVRELRALELKQIMERWRKRKI